MPETRGKETEDICAVRCKNCFFPFSAFYDMVVKNLLVKIMMYTAKIIKGTLSIITICLHDT